MKYNYKIQPSFVVPLYADDSQLYLPLRSGDSLQTLPECLNEINDNFLQFNNNETEVIIFSPSKTKNPIFADLRNLSHSQKLLHGVIFLILSYISSVIKNSFYQLRVISKIKHTLSYYDLKSYPCFYNITTGLLQLPLPWSPPVPHITSPNGSECSSKTADWVKKSESISHPFLHPFSGCQYNKRSISRQF